MKLQLVETKESSGDFFNIYSYNGDGSRKFIACLIFDEKNRAEKLKRAEEIMNFCYENGGSEKVIKELEYSEI